MEYVQVPKQEYEKLMLYKQIMTYVEEELHDEELKEEFVAQVEKIREEVKKGKKLSFKNKEEMNAYLKGL